MNKWGLALCASVLVFPMASAAEVTLYGKAHASLDVLNDGNDSGQFLSSNSSRLGVKASTDLGDGMTGLVQFETGVDLSNSGSAWGASRDSYVGVKGGFGMIIGGRLPAANQWVYDANYFADQVGDAGNFNGVGMPGRADHAVFYSMPVGEPLSVGVTYIPGQATGSAAKSSMGVKVGFSQGAIKAGAGYFNLSDNHKITTASAGYNFGAGSVAGIVVMRDSTDIDAATAGDQASKVTVFTLGAGFKMGAGTAKAQFSSAGESASGAKDGATMMAVGYDHPLNKSATAYIAYATVSNDTAGSYSATNWGHGADVGVAAAGKDPNGLSVGLVVNF